MAAVVSQLAVSGEHKTAADLNVTFLRFNILLFAFLLSVAVTAAQKTFLAGPWLGPTVGDSHR